MDASAGFVSRVIKLDSVTLDVEFFRIIKGQLFQLFDQVEITKSWLDKVGPELELLLKFIIWKFTVLKNGSTLGQKLLGIKFQQDKLKFQLLFFLEGLVPYGIQRIRLSLPRIYNKMDVPLQKLEDLLQICRLANFCVFLIQNRYPSVTHRVVGLPIVPAYQRVHPSVGYSYQIRELLWHQFADFLMIVLPLINFHKMKRYFNQLWSPRSAEIDAIPRTEGIVQAVLTCCVCKKDATLPQRLGSCVLCYYCLRANQLADPHFKCTNCAHFKRS